MTPDDENSSDSTEPESPDTPIQITEDHVDHPEEIPPPSIPKPLSRPDANPNKEDAIPAPVSPTPDSIETAVDAPAFAPPPDLDPADQDEEVFYDPDDPLNDIEEKVAEEEAIFNKLRNRDRLSAIAIAAFAHLIIFFFLTLFIIYGPVQPPPEIIAIAVPEGEAIEAPKEKVQRQQMKQSKPSAQMTKVVSAVEFSSVTVPNVDSLNPEDLAVGLATDDFGMGFVGLSNDGGFVASLPPAMQGRCTLVDRMARLSESGGNRKCEEAVHKALVWISEQQNDDGSFGEGAYPVAMTGLALLAYLGHCETPDSPEFSDTVVNAATFLMNMGIEGDGHMVSPKGKGAYEHAIATYALAELFTMTRQGKTKIPGLGELLEDAVDIIIDGQHSSGGWDYNYRDGSRDDTSVGGWQIQALRAAKNTKLDFNGYETSWDRAIRQIKRVQGREGGFGYIEPEDKISLTGVGVLSLQFADEGDSSEAQKGLEFILDTRKSLSYASANFYEWYYSTQACFLEGGRIWRDWNDMFLEEMLEAQDSNGRFPPGRNNREQERTKGDGDLYRTCLCTLMLEVYYRYLPTTAK
ncbi:MAG: prenyltransferase/squalene oxidase repeat-containing protein [Verrucomicrobiota bacterium]